MNEIRAGLVKKHHIITYGCQMNAADSQTLSGILGGAGYVACDDESEADLIIVNTCSVRDKAEERAMGRIQNLRRLKLARTSVIIAVVGCMAQRLGEKILARAPHVDIILGADRMFDIVDVLAQKNHVPIVHTDWGYENIDIAPPVRESPYSAYLTITRGCNNYCTFCIVPFVRGREKYYPADFLVRSAIDLAQEGVKELTLLGQNVNSYRDDKTDFPELLARIATESDIQRIRYTSPHPKDLSLRLIDAHANIPKLMPHVHLPLQSGSDRILEKMARSYRFRHYRNMVKMLRERAPGVALTTDIIVGFPGEAEADFQQTMSAFEEIQFESAFMFHYSVREGTRAWREFPDDVPSEVKLERLSRLIEMQKQISYQKNQLDVGHLRRTLVDGHSRRSESVLKGRTAHGKTILFAGDTSLFGKEVDIIVRSADAWTLRGDVAPTRSGYRPLGLFTPRPSEAPAAPAATPLDNLQFNNLSPQAEGVCG